MSNTPDSPAEKPDHRTDQGGNFWALFTPGIWKVLHAVLHRTRVASIFPNTASCLRLVSALLAECDEDWMSGKIYLNLQL
jgi:hypothetical protein